MIYLGIGSNLVSSFGDRFKNIDLAISHLEIHGVKLIKKSSFYESLSHPDEKNPKFINVVISVDTNLSPEGLMTLLLSIEKKLERKRGKKNDPRTCDIDIIDFNNEVLDFHCSNLSLSIPHKKLSDRNFVLYPLLEISPKWKHPVTHEKINDLIQKLLDEDKKSILKIEKN